MAALFFNLPAVALPFLWRPFLILNRLRLVLSRRDSSSLKSSGFANSLLDQGRSPEVATSIGAGFRGGELGLTLGILANRDLDTTTESPVPASPLTFES
jgi:hypothetical protein